MRDLFGELPAAPSIAATRTRTPAAADELPAWESDLFGRGDCDYWMVSLRNAAGKVIGREQKIRAASQKLACIRRLFKLPREQRDSVHRFDVGGTGNYSWEIVHWIYGDQGLKPIGVTDLVDPARPIVHWYE